MSRKHASGDTLDRQANANPGPLFIPRSTFIEAAAGDPGTPTPTEVGDALAAAMVCDPTDLDPARRVPASRIPKSRKGKLTDAAIRRLYVESHLTHQQIAALDGRSRAQIGNRLKAMGVATKQGTWVGTQCAFCGEDLLRQRYRARQSMRAFCNAEHYYAFIENPRYFQWRNGQRLARGVVSQHFRLKSEHVVHHRDGDNRNNNLSNLVVFASQADHMAHHRGRKVAPLWEGSVRTEESGPR